MLAFKAGATNMPDMANYKQRALQLSADLAM
jgi:hypothetical protein